MQWPRFIQSWLNERALAQDPVLLPPRSQDILRNPMQRLQEACSDLHNIDLSIDRWRAVLGDGLDASIAIGKYLTHLDSRSNDSFSEYYASIVSDMTASAAEILNHRPQSLTETETNLIVQAIETLHSVHAFLSDLQRLGCIRYQSNSGAITYSLVPAAVGTLMTIDPAFTVYQRLSDRYALATEGDAYRHLFNASTSWIVRSGISATPEAPAGEQIRRLFLDESPAGLPAELMRSCLGLLDQSSSRRDNCQLTHQLTDIVTKLPTTSDPLLLGDILGTSLALLESGHIGDGLTIAAHYRLDAELIRAEVVKVLSLTESIPAQNWALEWVASCPNAARELNLQSRVEAFDRNWDWKIGPWHQNLVNRAMAAFRP